MLRAVVVELLPAASTPAVVRLSSSSSRRSAGSLARPMAATAVLRPPPLLQRREEQLQRAVLGRTVRVMQWNTLADGLAQNGDFVRTPESALEWEARGPLLLEEVLRADADLVCMQEVNHFDDFFLPKLQEHGYSGVFKPKKKSPAQRYGLPPDGCAVFYRTKRFSLSDCIVENYTTYDGDLENQGLVVLRLRCNNSNNELLLANTHLKAKVGAENDSRRKRQALQLLEKLQLQAMPCVGDKVSALSVPVLLCGDFNATPFSPVCDTVRHHSLHLRSAYAFMAQPDSATLVNGHGDGGPAAEPQFTTWKVRTCGEKAETVDYIWYSGDGSLLPVRRWQLPTKSEIGALALPCSVYPSDHLALMCEFMWCDASETHWL
eukprot:jgi/Chlat1/5071/Chrsp33S05064